MDKFIALFFGKSRLDSDALRKAAYGKFSAVVGMIANILLFIGKFTVGTLFNSVSVVADGFNNLSDVGSSFVSFVSFKLSGKPADKKHPYGHARIEYITSMAVSFLVLLVGIELLKDSVEAIYEPKEAIFSPVMVIVLVSSVLIKLGLFLLNKYFGKKVNSVMMQATAADSLSDILATGSVLAAMLIGKFTAVNLDGYVGIIVACFILFAAYKVLRDTMNNIIGMAPEKEMIESINRFILSYPGILGVHDLIVHSYGTGNCFASAHAEVSGNENVFECHERIDRIEKEIYEKMKVHLVLHMDPKVTDNEAAYVTMRTVAEDIASLGQELGSSFGIHDFRTVKTEGVTNVIFDIEVPYECKYTDEQIEKIVCSRVKAIDESFCAVVNIDRR